MSNSSSRSSSNWFDAGDVKDIESRISLARVRFSFLIRFSQGFFCLVLPIHLKPSLISPIPRTVLGLQAVDAIEEAIVVGGIRGTSWLVDKRVLLGAILLKARISLVVWIYEYNGWWLNMRLLGGVLSKVQSFLLFWMIDGFGRSGWMRFNRAVAFLLALLDC